MKAIIALVVLLVAVLVCLLIASGNTAVAISPPVNTIGVTTPVTVQMTNPHGVRQVKAVLEQNGAQYPLFEQTHPVDAFLLAPPRAAPHGHFRSRQE